MTIFTDVFHSARGECDVSGLSWLGSVREVCYPLSRVNPIWVRESLCRGGLPLPTVPFPERHPYCELTINLQGSGIQHIGNETKKIEAGSVMLLGPGMPHTAEALDYPRHAITVYILPILFFDLGPNGDGPRILKRFTADQPIDGRILRIPPALMRSIRHSSQKMLEEFKNEAFGRELRLRALLMDLLVALFRWEEVAHKDALPETAVTNWGLIQRALQYIHQHHTEVIYVRQLAQAVRVGERQLNGLFRDLLGMGCIQYLNSYRVSLAASMLSTSAVPVTTVAYAVGFETLSHFNTTFRNVLGMSPTEYVRKKGASDAHRERHGAFDHLGVPVRPQTEWCAEAV